VVRNFAPYGEEAARLFLNRSFDSAYGLTQDDISRDCRGPMFHIVKHDLDLAMTKRQRRACSVEVIVFDLGGAVS
jgi:hypothetical protein